MGNTSQTRRNILALLLVFIAVLTNPAFAVTPNWTTAASYGSPVYESKVALLRSGKVLMVGGEKCCHTGTLQDLFTSPEIFDPQSGTWSPAGNIVFYFTEGSVTTLNSGKVLVAGGWTGYAMLATAQIYDPVNNSWNSAGSLLAARAGHTATLLSSGKVLITGGATDNYNRFAIPDAEIYDPQTDSWQVAASMISGRYYHTATLLRDGRVLVVGSPAEGSSSAEIYDPQRDVWTLPSQLAYVPYGHSATLLPDGKVMIAGGGTPTGITNRVELYDPATDHWTNAANLRNERAFPAATLLPSGKVLVAGGEYTVHYANGDSSGETLASTEIYDPTRDSWSPGAPMHEQRMQHSATLLHSGIVLVSGGASVRGFEATAELLATNTPGIFEAMQPARLLDTRVGATTIDGASIGGGALGPNKSLDLNVLNRAGLPAIGVVAVALNVTAVTPTEQGFVTVWPSGGVRPNTSNLNFKPGQIVPNMVIAQVGSNGKVSLFNSAGFTQIVVDIVGWFPATSGFSAFVPARLLDTRAGTNTTDGLAAGGGAMTTKAKLDLAVAGRAEIPTDAAGSALINLTATNTTAEGFLDLWTQGTTRPNTSSLNFAPAQTVPNLVIARTSDAGIVSIFNSAGSTDVIADLAGWFPASAEFNPVPATRLLDTRAGTAGIAAGPLVKHGVIDLAVNSNGLPTSDIGAVVLNVSVTDATGPGFLTVWPSGGAQPNASNLNFSAGQTRANLVISKVGGDGHVWISSSSPSVDVVVDAVGWFPPAQ